MKCRPYIDIPSSHTIFPKISRQTITRNSSKAADSIKKNILDNLKKFENVCLAIDAGKINGNPILDVSIVHVFSPSKPLFFRAFKEFIGTTDDYIAKMLFMNLMKCKLHFLQLLVIMCHLRSKHLMILPIQCKVDIRNPYILYLFGFHAGRCF